MSVERKGAFQQIEFSFKKSIHLGGALRQIANTASSCICFMPEVIRSLSREESLIFAFEDMTLHSDLWLAAFLAPHSIKARKVR